MTEPTDVRELRERIERAEQMVDALCRPRGEPGAREWAMSIPARPDHDPDLVIGDGLGAGRAALERLEELERFLDREGIRRGPIDHGLPTPTIVDRVEAYGYECAIRAIRATAAPAPQQGAEYEEALRTLLGPQPESFAELLARQSILQHQLKLVEQALDRPASATTPQQGGSDA